MPFSLDALGSLVANRRPIAGWPGPSAHKRIFVATTAFDTSCVLSPEMVSRCAFGAFGFRLLMLR